MVRRIAMLVIGACFVSITSYCGLQFTSASSQRGVANYAPISSFPFSLHCKVAFDATNTTQAAFSMCKISASASRIGIFHLTTSNTIYADIQDAIGAGATLFATNVTVPGTVYSVTVVGASSNNYSLYVDGELHATSSTTVNLTANLPDQIIVGARYSSGALGLFLGGKVYECAIWNSALTQDDAKALYKDMSPARIRADGLVFYSRLIGKSSPEINVVGGGALNLTNGPTSIPHVRVY